MARIGDVVHRALRLHVAGVRRERIDPLPPPDHLVQLRDRAPLSSQQQQGLLADLAAESGAEALEVLPELLLLALHLLDGAAELRPPRREPHL
eukprot:CAMPEP_0176153062 /NCGR_PEP_ID=MMETSP0120_2-20121206/78179_1 /TAXON_ID=160619 /ORGANISM="Kryptoperidinium foliaceum, Strain CCMP 1326" /LENGTH=92 /DNA_ID=CAMNT_0017490091 /DNA_START=32 /DNA_END=311 /DNA_ORIENTATION=-